MQAAFQTVSAAVAKELDAIASVDWRCGGAFPEAEIPLDDLVRASVCA